MIHAKIVQIIWNDTKFVLMVSTVLLRIGGVIFRSGWWISRQWIVGLYSTVPAGQKILPYPLIRVDGSELPGCSQLSLRDKKFFLIQMGE